MGQPTAERLLASASGRLSLLAATVLGGVAAYPPAVATRQA